MNRRQLLRSALGLAALPALAPTAWASGSPKEQRAVLSNAWRSAAQRKVPLLVLVIPPDDGDKWPRGQVLGEWLNNASDAQLAPLSQVEVVCATVADLRKLVPGIKAADDAWFVWVDPQAPEAAKVLNVTLPAPPPNRPDYGDEGFYGEKHEEWVRLKIAGNTIAIEGVLGPLLADLGTVEVNAAQAVRAKLIDEPPPGAHWAIAGGCGTHVEGVETSMAIGCGMGHVPAASRRFLYLNDVASFQGF